MEQFWQFFLKRRQFSYVLIVALAIAGIYALISIPKENMPAIQIPDGFVITTLPGASAADVETLITDPLEDQISGIANIDTMTSNSSNGISEITVQFNANANLDQSIQNLRDAVAKASGELPSDASTPDVSKIDFSNQPIIVASVSGNLTPLGFSTLGTTLSQDLKNVAGVSEVDVAGVPDREVDVLVNRAALAQYDLTLSQIVSAIAATNAALPAGSISMNGVNYEINFQGGLTDPSQVSQIAVGEQNGSPIYLRDIATISNGLAPASTYSRLSVNSEPSTNAITLTVFKQSDADIKTVADSVRSTLNSLQSSTLKGLTLYISPATDQGTQVSQQLGSLSETGLETVLLVIIVLLFTIGWRESLVAALSIPLSFLIAFLALYLTHNTLNFISLFALILAVGILVDSGIVVTEAIHARMRIYGDALTAAKAAIHDYAWPLIAGTMATVAVFAPLFFISGIIGKFIAGIPYTLIFVLIASIFVALGIVPLIAMGFTKRNQNHLEKLAEGYTDRVTEWYKRFLGRILSSRKIQKYFLRGLVVLFIVSLLLPFTGIVTTAFFPQSNEDYVYVNITTPQGTTLEKTDLVAREVEEMLYQDHDIAAFQTTVGESSSLSDGAGSGGSNLANITINLPEERKETSTQIVTKLEKQFSSITDATIQVLQPSESPTQGAPIQIQFEGNNLTDLNLAAQKGKQLLETIPGATNISASTDNNGTEFDLSIDRAKAAALGLSTAQIAQTLRTAVSGSKATSITTPDQTVDVIVKLDLSGNGNPDNASETTLDTILNLTVMGSKGPVLLGSVLDSALGPSNAAITHKDKTRLVTVSAYPAGKTTTGEVISQFQKQVSSLNLPSSVSVSYGGETEDINQSFTQMFAALLAGLILMFMILVVAFNSIKYTVYLLSIVPLSLIGVLDGLALSGQPVSFTSLLGVIALGGVIINHAIILMDSMIHYRRHEPDVPIREIVVKAAATRLRPVLLTTITTVIGMIPLSLADASWAPLAFTIMFGLAFAIVLTLILVPVLFFRAQKPSTASLPQE